MAQKRLSKIEVEQMVSEYSNGMQTKILAEKFGVSSVTINNWIRKTGTPLKPVIKKYSYNEEFFSIIDSEEKAYFLGLLYADGCNHGTGFSISLQDRDLEVLEQFKSAIQYTGPINFYQPKQYNLIKKPKMTCRLNFCGRKVAKDLSNLGCFQRKSLILKFPSYEQVPEPLVRHFIRGYFDGDGSVSFYSSGPNQHRKSKASFIGTLEFLNGIEYHLNKNGINTCRKIENNKYNKKYPELKNCWNMAISGTLQVENLLNYLYKDCKCFIRRKMDKLNLISSYKRGKVKPVIATNILSGEMVEYKSVLEAERLSGVNFHKIRKHCYYLKAGVERPKPENNLIFDFKNSEDIFSRKGENGRGSNFYYYKPKTEGGGNV